MIDFIIACLPIIVVFYVVVAMTLIFQAIVQTHWVSNPSISFIEIIGCVLWPFVAVIMIVSVILGKLGWHCSD